MKKENLYPAQLAGIHPVTGAADILQWANDLGLRCAVVTTSPRTSAELVLKRSGLLRFLDFLIAGDEVERGKPDPLPYQVALQRLGIGSSSAVAFEDSLPGIASASSAGIPTVGVISSLGENALLQAGAVRTARDFHDTDMQRWASELVASHSAVAAPSHAP